MSIYLYHFRGSYQSSEKSLNPRKTAIIIGAGVGGLSTAILLARSGYQITVLEKNKYLGGRCGQIEKSGHFFDTGPTFLIFPDLYRQMFHAFGEKLDDHLKLLHVDPSQRIYFDDNSTLDCTQNLELMKDQLDVLEDGSYLRFLAFLERTKRYHEIVLSRIISQDFPTISSYINLKNITELAAANSLANHQRWIKQFFRDLRLQAAFSFQDTYIGLDPHTSPAIFSMFAYEEFKNGVFLPKGGMHEVVKALVKIARKNGVNIKAECPVERIEVRGKSVSAVVTKTGEKYTPHIVVANADLPYVYRELLPKNSLAKKLEKKRYACSTITFLWGLKKKYSQLSTHNLFLAKSYQKSYRQVVSGHGIPDEPHFYVHAPSRTDRKMAPKNQDTLTAIMPIGHLNPKKEEKWDEIVGQARKFILTRLANLGLADVAENIKFEICFNPKNWQSQYNLTHGTTLGLHHNISQMGYLRPKRKSPLFKNLYFTGSNTHPGSGVPTVMLSSLFTHRQILKDCL